MNEIVQSGGAMPLSHHDIQNQVNTIQHVMQQVMKQNVHYGIIPGCKEPTLYKPGAEKIMATFRLSADPEVNDLSDQDQIRYQVKVRLHSPTGVFVGAGIGECSSGEEKYKWRKAVCPQEFDDTPIDRRREKWCRGWNNKPPYQVQQVRTDPADLANTILKMAKKRALIDAVLTATAASDCFTQDIEDLPPEYMEGQEQQASTPQYYPSSSFDTNFPAWRKAIEGGQMTPDQVITKVQSKALLTDQQKQQIRKVKANENA